MEIWIVMKETFSGSFDSPMVHRVDAVFSSRKSADAYVNSFRGDDDFRWVEESIEVQD